MKTWLVGEQDGQREEMELGEFTSRPELALVLENVALELRLQVEREQGLDADTLDRLAEEAEQGYDPQKLRPRRERSDREHIVKVPAAAMVHLRNWLTDPNGAYTVGAVTFESVEDGGILVRTRSWRPGDLT